MLARWLKILETVRHLTPSQIAFYVLRRGLPTGTIKIAAGTQIARRETSRHSFPQHNNSLHEAKTAFTFLNVTRAFGNNINWCPNDVNRLWRYNLHYFDYLQSPTVSSTCKTKLIDDWIDHNPQGTEPAWEPYTVSLRITNWCKFILQTDAESIPAHWLNSLYLQATWLSANTEKHILANHYFENLRALAFAGTTLNGDKPNAWLKTVNRELAIQLDEQFLADGGHYERSPAYHAVVLEGCLDLLTVAELNTELFSKSLAQQLRHTLQQGLTVLACIVDPHGNFPLFGDSAYGAGPTLKALNTYAVNLGIDPAQPKQGLIEANDTGLFGYRHNEDWVLVDCGEIGPAYQPGHTHCDFLSFVIMSDGEHLIVDSGVCEYEPGETRAYVRSTAAHNTVTVDDTEQSQVWGEFRVAKRAKRLTASLSSSDGKIRFAGSYRGFFDLQSPITHLRELDIQLMPNGAVTGISCRDHLGKRGQYVTKQRLHLHPNITTQQEPNGGLLLTTKKGNRWRLQHNSAATLSLEPSWYCPEFGKKLANQCIVLTSQTQLPDKSSFSLKRL